MCVIKTIEMNMTLRIYSFTLFAHKLQDRHNIQTDEEEEEENDDDEEKKRERVN